MARPDIPAAKRAGLPVDLNRLTAEGDSWLSAEERYSLKAHGVCAQAQLGVFMIRVRVPGGRLSADQLDGLAQIADRRGAGWVHLTTRQQLELHHVEARQVTAAIAEVAEIGLTTRATCGHSVRGVMACPEAGLALDEPFDCRPDARAVSDALLAISPDLTLRLPGRLNIAFGGCSPCRDAARLNDVGFVSVLRSGEAGYQLWLGGSLGKSQPTLAMKAVDFLPRASAAPAAQALVEIYLAYGNFDQPGKGRLKFLVRDLGPADFLALFHDAFGSACQRSWPAPARVDIPAPAAVAAILGQPPPGGWRGGVRPQRAPGRALATVNVPLGDLDGDDLRGLAEITRALAGCCVHLTANQNLLLDLAHGDLPALEQRLDQFKLSLEGADQARDVRVCTGGPVCDLALTPAQALGAQLLDHPGLSRNAGLRVHVSGCGNACAQHQIADIGLSGSKVTVGGASRLGYQVWLGGDVAAGRIGQVAGRVAEADVPGVVAGIVGAWEALRRRGEPLAATIGRVGLEAFEGLVAEYCGAGWIAGPEPERPGAECGRQTRLDCGGGALSGTARTATAGRIAPAAPVRVCALSDLPPGAMVTADVDGRRVVVVNCDGRLLAAEDRCPHAGGPLSEGTVTGCVVQCPWHGARFDLSSGAPLRAPARKPLARYRAAVSDGVVLVSPQH